MITTDTGAKKIENSDNWRQIFDAHNDSVDAEDKIVPEMAPIVNGNKSTVGAAIGEYVLVRNSSITGITDGAYTAAKVIPANTTIDSTYLTAVGTGGALNALNSKIQSVTFSGSTNSNGIYFIPTTSVALTDTIIGVSINKGHYWNLGVSSAGDNQTIRITDLRGDAMASETITGTFHILKG